MQRGEIGEEKSLASTPTWALATVITVMVCLGFFFQACLEQLGKWLNKTKRKALLSALEKIKDELMLFGFLSLLMGHWVVIVAKICVKSSAMSGRYFPCAINDGLRSPEGTLDLVSNHTNDSSAREKIYNLVHSYNHCPEGHESFASQESLEQLHRLMFILGVVHVLYSFIAIALAMIKIHSWNIWEKEAEIMATTGEQGSHEVQHHHRRMTRLTTFVSRRTTHPWSQHRILVWLLCFSRQFWSSINYADYMALRYGFITKHELPLKYDFHSYMLRNTEEDFRDTVGISLPIWIYAVCCIFLDFHETDVYFWISFLPSIIILLTGTKLHRIVVKLAVEIKDTAPRLENHTLNLRDELFWFGKPKLLLWVVQLLTFQNAFEMATFLWSMWEIKDSSCFMPNQLFAIIRLTFGIASQFWCSFITFPLYIIVTQMESKFKKTVVSENVRQSLHEWKRRVKARHSSSCVRRKVMRSINDSASSSAQGSTSGAGDTPTSYKEASITPQADSNDTSRKGVAPHDDDDDSNIHSI